MLADLRQCREVQSQHHDLDFDVVDSSVVALSERFGETTVATLDHRHFAVVCPRRVDAFILLP